MTHTDTMLPTLAAMTYATDAIRTDDGRDDEASAGSLLYQHLDCHGWSVTEGTEGTEYGPTPNVDADGTVLWDERTMKAWMRTGELQGIQCVESWDADTERPTLLSVAQLDNLCEYYRLTQTNVTADCWALWRAMGLAESRADGAELERIREVRAALMATAKAGRCWEADEDGLDRYSLGSLPVVTRSEAEQADDDRDMSELDGDTALVVAAWDKANDDGMGDFRRAMADERNVRAAKLWAYIAKHGQAFYRLAVANRWTEAQEWADKLKECGDGIRKRYLATVEACRERNEWSGLYLTRAQRDTLVQFISAAFAAVKARPKARPKHPTAYRTQLLINI